MMLKFLILLPVFFYFSSKWHNNLKEAEEIAQKEHKCILLNFSGSDWCGPCIRMRKEIFDSETFVKMADTELVLVNADFPRNKKNQLEAGQQKINDEMADKYNAQGKFPYTLLMNSDGKILQSWDGLPDESAESFTLKVHDIINANR